MVLKLYGYPTSSNYTRIVAMILSEKKVPFEFVHIEMDAGEHKSPAFLEKQPFGQIPVIVRSLLFSNYNNPGPLLMCALGFQDDDGYILYESRAICRYIAAKYADQGTKLIPTESIQAIGLFEQAASIEQVNFSQHAQVIIFEMLAKP